MKDELAKLKTKQMDRRGFLVWIGSALLTLLGVSAFVRAILHGPHQLGLPPSSSADNRDYSNGVYGARDDGGVH